MMLNILNIYLFIFIYIYLDIYLFCQFIFILPFLQDCSSFYWFASYLSFDRKILFPVINIASISFLLVCFFSLCLFLFSKCMDILNFRCLFFNIFFHKVFCLENFYTSILYILKILFKHLNLLALYDFVLWKWSISFFKWVPRYFNIIY